MVIADIRAKLAMGCTANIPRPAVIWGSTEIVVKEMFSEK